MCAYVFILLYVTNHRRNYFSNWRWHTSLQFCKFCGFHTIPILMVWMVKGFHMVKMNDVLNVPWKDTRKIMAKAMKLKQFWPLFQGLMLCQGLGDCCTCRKVFGFNTYLIDFYKNNNLAVIYVVISFAASLLLARKGIWHCVTAADVPGPSNQSDGLLIGSGTSSNGPAEMSQIWGTMPNIIY